MLLLKEHEKIRSSGTKVSSLLADRRKRKEESRKEDYHDAR